MTTKFRAIAIVFGIGLLTVAFLVYLSGAKNQPALISYAFTLDDKGQLPGESTGSGTVFEVRRSSFKDISVTFDKKTQAHVESITGMVGLRMAASKGDRSITIAHLDPNTTYYKYTDHLDAKEEITTDATGSATFKQDTSQEHYVMIFTHPSTYFIEDTASGRDCETIGAWNTTTKTCTLDQDITQSIEIKDNGITLDGAGHILQGPDSNIGIYVNGGIFGDITDVTVKNIVAKGFSKGIQINNTQRVHLTNVTVSNNSDGVEFYRAETSSITDSTMANNTGTGLIIGTSSDINGVTNNIITSNSVGIDLGLNSSSSISRNTITLNGNGVAISAIGGADTFLWQNNLENTNEVSILFDGDTQFYKDQSLRGNFWAKHTCTQDPTNKSFCTNKYLVKDRPLLSDIYDEYPWACKDGWSKACPTNSSPPTTISPPPGGSSGGAHNYNICKPGGEWAEVRNSAGAFAIVRDSSSASGKDVKEIPNAWVVHLEGENTNGFSKIKDTTDGLIGWIVSDQLCTNPDRTDEFLENIKTLPAPRDRKATVTKSVAYYLANTATQEQLYSSGGTRRDGTSINITKLTKNNFPSDLYLAMLVEEGGDSTGRVGGAGGKVVTVSWENPLKTWDGGYGITQMTGSGRKGIASRLKLLDEKCIELMQVKYLGTYVPEYLCDLYTNSIQGIYANVKDGLSTLFEKYDTYDNNVDTEPTDKTWATSTNLTINNAEMKNLLALRGYNGFAEKCDVFYFGTSTPETDQQLKYDEYLTRVAKHLLTLPATYEDSSLQTYSTSSDLYREINLAFQKRQEICIKSPATLSITDPAGRITGMQGGKPILQIPEVVYDTDEGKAASIIFPQGPYTYMLTGTADGTYTVIFQSFDNATTPVEFVAKNIPTHFGEKHKYNIDWQKLAQGGEGVTVSLDQDGDGVFETTFTSDKLLTASEFASHLNSATICHIPPGNPSNAHTITVGKSAVKAHLAHGDHEGPCATVSTNTDKEDEKEPADENNGTHGKKKGKNK